MDACAKEFYLKEIEKLQVELLKLQNWVKKTNQKIVIILERRLCSGQRRDDQSSHRAFESTTDFRIVALPKPTEIEKTQWYFTRYISTLPSGGEIVFFDEELV